MGWLGKDTDREGAGEGLGRCGSGYGEGLGRCGSERAAPAGVRSPRSLSTRLLLSLGQAWPRESTCRPHLRGDSGRSYTIHGPKTPGSRSCNLDTDTSSSHPTTATTDATTSFFFSRQLSSSTDVLLCACISLSGDIAAK